MADFNIFTKIHFIESKVFMVGDSVNETYLNERGKQNDNRTIWSAVL